MGLPREKLQSTAQHRDRRNEEQANSNYNLTCEQRIAFDDRLLTGAICL